MITVLLTRSPEDNERLKKLLPEKDFQCLSAPLLETIYLSSPAPPKDYAALLISSRRAIEAMRRQNLVTTYATKRLYIIGEETAADAKAAGLFNIEGIFKDHEEWQHIATAHPHLPFLHVRGETTLPDLEHHPQIIPWIMYRTLPATMDQKILQRYAAALSPKAVLFFSGQAATHGLAWFASQNCQDWGDIFCLSERIAAIVKASPLSGVQHVGIAKKPTERELVKSLQSFYS
jgi:uroporphyrinogen-III synthase